MYIPFWLERFIFSMRWALRNDKSRAYKLFQVDDGECQVKTIIFFFRDSTKRAVIERSIDEIYFQVRREFGLSARK